MTFASLKLKFTLGAVFIAVVLLLLWAGVKSPYEKIVVSSGDVAPPAKKQETVGKNERLSAIVSPGLAPTLGLKPALSSEKISAQNMSVKRGDLGAQFVAAMSSSDATAQIKGMYGIWWTCLRYIDKRFGDQSALIPGSFVELELQALVPRATDLYSNLDARCKSVLHFSSDDRRRKSAELSSAGHHGALLDKTNNIFIKKDLTQTDLDLVDRVLANAELRAEFVYLNDGHLRGRLEEVFRPNLSFQEAEAAVWAATCLLGADCTDFGFVTALACFRGHVCLGNSVQSGIEAQFSAAGVERITKAAEALVEMLGRGSAGLGLKKK